MARPPRRRRPTPALLVLCGAFVVAFAGIYIAAISRGPGARADRDALAADAANRLGVPGPLSELLGTISVGGLALAGLAAVALALWRGHPHAAVAALVVLGGANITAQALKQVLATPGPLGLESGRVFADAFPSGHATAAASVGLAILIAVGPELRRPVAAAAVVYAAGVGIALVALGWHYPSDVLAGYLVAGAWAAAVGAVLGPGRSGAPRESGGYAIPVLVGLGVIGVGVIVVLADRAWPEFIIDNTSFVVSAFLIAAAGALVISTVAARLDGRPDL